MPVIFENSIVYPIKERPHDDTRMDGGCSFVPITFPLLSKQTQ